MGLESKLPDELAELLIASLSIRVGNVPLSPKNKSPARLAVLFSGGLDCTLLARLCHEILPRNQDIDLLNVAFENPRVVKAASQGFTEASFKPMTAYSTCPDRITGLKSYEELLCVCPGRTWRFVSIDVPYQELLIHRHQVIALIRPHRTEMDLSIASALYFAARGKGTISSSETGVPSSYATSARILLSGLGADELFGGYTRHAIAFVRRGYDGLLQELELDFQRLGKRNLGRDDRVISHWGREARYPYLDESLVNWALQTPIWEKCGFGQIPPTAVDPQQYPAVEPSKALLRLLAWKLGMTHVAIEKKRAIQFGARTAKMECGRSKGSQVL